MLKNLQRVKRLWELSKKDSEVLDLYETLTPEDIKEIPNAKKGEGKAVFFGVGTEEEYIEQVRKDKGLAGWYERLKNL